MNVQQSIYVVDDEVANHPWIRELADGAIESPEQAKVRQREAIDTVREVVDAYPFEREVDGYQSYVTFVADPAVLDELAALSGKAGSDEKISRGEGVVYWQVPKGSTLDSTIGKTMGKPRYKSSTTTRNLRTLDKVLR